VNADMVCVSSGAGVSALQIWKIRGMFLREVGYRKEWVLVKDIALDEPLKQIPRHWCLAGAGRV
jgi:hypothetical protein